MPIAQRWVDVEVVAPPGARVASYKALAGAPARKKKNREEEKIKFLPNLGGMFFQVLPIAQNKWKLPSETE